MSNNAYTTPQTTTPTIKIYVKQKNGITGFLRAMSESAATTHSRTIREKMISNDERTGKYVVLEHVSGGPLNLLLNKMERFEGRLRLNVHDCTFWQVVILLETINTLGIEPPQPQVEGHLVGETSHRKLTPKEMMTVHAAFGYLGEENKLWRTVIYHTAYNHVYEKFIDAEWLAMTAAFGENDEPKAAIEAKIVEVQEMKAQKEQRGKSREERKARVRNCQAGWKKHHANDHKYAGAGGQYRKPS